MVGKENGQLGRDEDGKKRTLCVWTGEMKGKWKKKDLI